MDTDTSRRALIGGAGLAAVLAGVPAIAAATANPATFDRGWTKVVAAYTRAKGGWEAAWNAYEDAHIDFRGPAKPDEPQLMGEVLTSMTIDQIRAIPFDRDWQEYEAELAAWKGQREHLKQKAYGHLERAAQEALSRHTDTLAALKAYPVPTFALLCEKVALLKADYGEDGEGEYARHIFADLRRLTKREG